MKVVMTGGGTAGHVNPALAIAGLIREKHPDAEIIFIGTKKGLENRLVPKAGYPLYHVEIQGLRRSLSPENLKTAYLTLTSVGKAKKILKKFSPDIVIGTGGYVSYPVIKAASKLGIPTALHESNVVPGLTVKLLAPHADILFTDFANTADYFKEKYRKKIRCVGNPYEKKPGGAYTYERGREELGIAHKYRHYVLCFGGSLGAGMINETMLQMMKTHLKDKPGVFVTHATGSGNYDTVMTKAKELGLDQYPNLEILDYVYDMPRRMAAADVVICRSGAMTLSELALYEKASVLIPSPNVTNNQQYKNAAVLRDAGAAELIEEKELSVETLWQAVSSVLEDREKSGKMKENIRAFAHPDANEKIMEGLEMILRKRRDRV